MTTEIKFKDYRQIMDEVKAKAKIGSCKTCQFCIRLGIEAFRSDYPKNTDEKEIPTCICEMQDHGGFWLTDSDLEREPYPVRCDAGHWFSRDDDGKETDILECLAFKPHIATTKDAIEKATEQQRDFLSVLSEASKCHNCIEDVTKGKTQSRLDELVKKLNENA